MILVGSQALQICAPSWLDREPAVCDVVGTIEELSQFTDARAKYPLSRDRYKVVAGDGLIIDYEIAWPGSSGEELTRIVGGWGFAFGVKRGGAWVQAADNVDLLFALKTSHRFLRNSPHFEKTMRDWRAMRARGAKIRPEHADWLRRREAETYDYAHPRLAVSKRDFFSRAGRVTYTFDHDTVHEAVRHLDRPAYTYFKPEGSEVMCDRGMFEAAPIETRLFSVLEEAYVLALERSQIPHAGKISPRQSFRIALEKVCTSISSGWWREFAYEHYHEVDALYTDAYVGKFLAGVEDGTVKRIEAKDQASGTDITEGGHDG